MAQDAIVRLVLLAVGLLPTALNAAPVSNAAKALLVAGHELYVVAELDSGVADRAATMARAGRGLVRDDNFILGLRSAGYTALKTRTANAVQAADAVPLLDYSHLPLTVWRLASLAALKRLEADSNVRMVHENLILRPVSVSDLGFINQPQAGAQGAAGAGTTIAVIDGGLGTNYNSFADFGSCTAVATPAATCRVVFNKDFYPGASSETPHGTNVSAIALGVAPAAKLAMFDIFNGATASSVDVLSAMNTAISNQATFNIVAINLSLGDGSTNATPCANSIFAAAVTSAANAGITTVAAAGNSGSKQGLGNPACVPGVVSVGAVYDASYGTVGWVASADAGGQCTDASAADHVTCFSQSASYLSMLAPGTFVNAPSSAFQQSGTSQATPHVSGAVAVLRARYPAETLSQTLQRLQLSNIRDADIANGVSTPRLDLLAAVAQGTALTLTGTGPTQATAGASATYTLIVKNAGPLAATHVVVIDILPPGAVLSTTPAGCAVSGSTVTCAVGVLAVGGTATLVLPVTWSVSGAVYDSASVTADQIDTAPPSQQALAIGLAPVNVSDGPLPLWTYGLLVLLMGFAASRQLGRLAPA